MTLNEALLRLHVERLREQVEALEARAEELAFRQWQESTVFPQAVERWVEGCK